MIGNRRAAGTTLVEILVVIVVFAIGILAVVQLFPKGFQVLKTARDTTVATQLARDEIERLKARTDQLPEEILPVYALGSTIVVDDSRSGSDLGPEGDSIASDGTLSRGGTTVGPWALASGANVFRRVIGEGRRVPAPVQVGTQFGGLMILQFGPVFQQVLDTVNSVNSPVIAYGSDLVRNIGLPGANDDRQDYEYFVSNPNNAGIALSVPTGPTDRRYRIVLSAYVQNGTGTAKRDFVGLQPVAVPASTPDATTGLYPLYSIPLSSLLSSQAGVTLYGVEPDSIRVSRVFTPIATANNFSTNDPYEYKVLSPTLGVLMFNPLAVDVTVGGPSGMREPLQAKVDYDVYDWRIIREEFRVPDGPNPQHRLALGNLRTANSPGADGISSAGIYIENLVSSISDPKASHFIAMDLATGGIYAEVNGSTPLITVDKSLGLVTFHDADPSKDGVQGLLLYPGGATTPTEVNLSGRAIRVLYMANDEWSVQVLKAASSYSMSTGLPGAAQYYVGGSNTSVGGVATRIYFSPSDAGRKITIDELDYLTANGPAQLLGQDFVIQYNRPDTLALPSIDLRSAVPDATSFTFANGYAVQGVKGASVAVRVLHNPERFTLTQDPAQNITRLEQWGRNWKRSTTETYLQRGEIVR